ncbi:MAG TPA: DUF2269 family protein [Actinomycetota bacterium]|nr:DUF2269 family protein [Actinomycetota bacterium]
MLYKILLFVHVTGVVFWVGAGGAFQIMAERVAKMDSSRVKAFIQTGSLVPSAYFGILTAVVLVSGVWMVVDSGIGFEQPFVVAGVVGLIASGAIGGAVMGKTSASLYTLVASPNFDEKVMNAGVAKMRTFGRLDLAIMLFVIYMMTVKPGT